MGLLSDELGDVSPSEVIQSVSLGAFVPTCDDTCNLLRDRLSTTTTLDEGGGSDSENPFVTVTFEGHAVFCKSFV